jgi:hypothetical protein
MWNSELIGSDVSPTNRDTRIKYSSAAKIPENRQILNSNSKMDRMINIKYKKIAGKCNNILKGRFKLKIKIRMVGILISKKALM